MMEKDLFLNPPSIYGTAPLWVWNDEMSEEQIRYQLMELKEHGFGGAFVHPRPGLVTEYLSDEWFARWKEALDIAEELGLKLYIYDENSYPSGFAGGHVSAQLPDCLANSIVYKEMDINSLRERNYTLRDIVKAYAFEKQEDLQNYRITHDVTEISPSSWNEYGDQFLVFKIEVAATSSWLGGFAYVDLMRPEVAKYFLETTYEEYAKRFGDSFGTSIPAIFTDEPAVASGNVYVVGSSSLPFSYWFANEFERRNGYDIKDYLPCLFLDVDPASFQKDVLKVRYDYYCTVRELWAKNFTEPISKWCEEHGISYTGHYMEHQWPYPWGGMASPAVMSFYEYMHWPAIDMLLTNLLKDGPEALLLSIREVQSVANQFERERVLCETYGAGGWDSTFEDYKRIGDWLLVNGVNFINQHLTYSTIVGARKRDHPQSFDWRQPWWGEYKYLNEYLARVSYALSQGQTKNRILLLHPTTSAFLEKVGSDQGWDLMRPNIGRKDPEVLEYLSLIQRLSDYQWDYDLGDEFIMERHGAVEGSSITVHSRSYDLVIVPGFTKNIKQSTYDLLTMFLESGGKVVALGKEPERVEGEYTSACGKLINHPNWIQASSLDDLESELTGALSSPFLQIKQADRLPSGISHLRRDLGDGTELYFLVNSSNQTVAFDVQIDGYHLENWNPWNGDVQSLPFTRERGKVVANIELSGSESILLKVNKQKTESTLVQTAEKSKVTTVLSNEGVTEVALESDNTYLIDYCDVVVGNKEYKQVNTIYASQLVYQHHGFDKNPWDNTVQYKRRFLDREPFPASSGFTVTYYFQTSGSLVPTSLELIVERAEYYTLNVNGQSVDWSGKADWLDHHTGVADIAPFVHSGTNAITLTAKPFHVLLEVEPVYLKGSFRVEEQDGRWVLAPESELATGSWLNQGLPFYSGAVLYKRHLTINDLADRYCVRLSEWEGTVVSVHVNGEYSGMIIRKNEMVDITSLLHQGDNEIVVRVCGSFKNLLGPHHDPEKPRGTAWPGNWKMAPHFGQVPANQYDVISYGLIEDFTIEKLGE